MDPKPGEQPKGFMENLSLLTAVWGKLLASDGLKKSTNKDLWTKTNQNYI